MARRKRRYFMLDSTDLAEQTAALSAEEFRAWILLHAWINENELDSEGWVHIAYSRLLTIAPNQRNSASRSERVVREMCAKMSRVVRDECARESRTGRERTLKLSILMEKPEENQHQNTPKKEKEKEKEKEKFKRTSKPPPPAWALGLSDELISLLAEHDPGAPTAGRRVPWARAIAKIAVPPAEIHDALVWLFSPANREAEFRFVVQSGAKLHQNLGKIQAQMARSGPKENPHVRNAKSILARIHGTQAQDADGSVFHLPSGEH